MKLAKWILSLAALGLIGWFLYSSYRTQVTVSNILERLVTEDINDRFHSYATRISGKQSLHVARLDRMEVYERTSHAKALGIPLPDVVVGIEFPVEYNFMVSLSAPWKFVRDDHTLVVYVPELSSQTPAVNVSRMKFDVKKGSFIRNETAVKERLQKELTGYLTENSILLREQVRVQAKESIREFVTTWLGQIANDEITFNIIVLFPGESVGESAAEKSPAHP